MIGLPFWFSEIPENVLVTRFTDKMIHNFSFPQGGGRLKTDGNGLHIIM